MRREGGIARSERGLGRPRARPGSGAVVPHAESRNNRRVGGLNVFSAPPVVETTIFAMLPRELRVENRPCELARHIGRPLDSFLEGPSFDREGNLYCVDVAHSRIFRVDPRGRFEVVVEYEGESNGLKIHRDGRLFVADRRHGIVTIDPATRRIEHLADRCGLELFRGPNDLVFGPDGSLYFTDQGMSDLLNATGRVYRLSAEGRLDLLLDRLPSPNGIALDASGRTLFVALTRANSIIRVPVLAEGGMARVHQFIQLSGGGGPDGIATDSQGGLAVAHPMMGAVWLFDAKGQPTLRVNLCRGALGTNLAFGGPDRRRLYITESETGTIQVAEVPVAGTRLFSHS
jgi:gluconolactonase